VYSELIKKRHLHDTVFFFFFFSFFLFFFFLCFFFLFSFFFLFLLSSFSLRYRPAIAMTFSYLRFLDHTKLYTKVGRTPSEE
jgi:hypothetical protein